METGDPSGLWYFGWCQYVPMHHAIEIEMLACDNTKRHQKTEVLSLFGGTYLDKPGTTLLPIKTWEKTSI